MLTQIHISNLVTIQEVNLDFIAGTTVITGDTGAGKSILIDAIELALGDRATSEVVRAGQEKADISLGFDISNAPEAIAWLQQYDLYTNTNECIIRRTITKEGRSRSYINGMPTTLQPLRELSELLINIHGQHEHQTLLKSEMQRLLLDQYAGHTHLVDQVHALADEWNALSREIIELKKLTNERKQHTDYVKIPTSGIARIKFNP